MWVAVFKRGGSGRLAARVLLAVGLVAGLTACVHDGRAGSGLGAPRTPIRHLVVVYLENVSFDHYFGTYPHAANPAGEPAVQVVAGTPTVDGLTSGLLTRNPNGVNPQRLDRSQAVTCDNNHGYDAEQKAFDGGRMDRFLQATAPGTWGCDASGVMDYFDGNTVTALWNYAQRYAMSDDFHEATFGPSLPGHLNLVAGQTHGARVSNGQTAAVVNGTVIGNVAARYEDCASTNAARVSMSGRNIGDLLSARGITWGYFAGGFRPTSYSGHGRAVCGSSHRNAVGQVLRDYSPDGVGEPFQYWKSTANPQHLAPSSVAEIGHAGHANHQYDLADFWRAAAVGNLPAVSFLKPASYQSGHPGESDPLAEQRFTVDTINRIQRLPTWTSTAVVIAYDDSDGWYDHQLAPITNPSYDPTHDALSGPGHCGRGTPLAGFADRCGPGPRLPLLVISPFARRNAVDHSLTTQVSITRFIEDNWLGGRRLGDGSFDASAGTLNQLLDFTHPHYQPLYLNPGTGEPVN